MAIGPIVTLTTDFGLTDFYVAAMKAVLLSHCTTAILIDITHQIPRHDLRSASFTLERAIHSFGSGALHLAVVDPGVGTDRRLMVAEINNSTIICPDNGLITWAWRHFPAAKAHELTWRPASASNTFHGRDIMAPVAGMIAAGRRPADFTGEPIVPLILEMHPSNTTEGEVIHIDHFGNATTNIPARVVTTDLVTAAIGDGQKIPIRRTYGDAEMGKALALIGSSNLLEIAVRNGSAAESLHIQIGDKISLF
jgi:S-adenosylmethionine hydrolase